MVVSIRRELVILFCVLLLAPAVLGASVRESHITYLDKEIVTLGVDKTIQPVRFTFQIEGNDLEECKPLGDVDCQVMLDISSFNSAIPGYANMQFPLTDCDENISGIPTFTCTENGLALRGENNTLNYQILVFAPSLVVDHAASFSITLDNTTPILTSLKTAFCKNSTCYVGSNAPTHLTAYFDDSVTSYDFKLVKFDVGGASAHATECMGSECVSVVESNACTNGAVVPIKVTNYYSTIPSSEDSLNPVDNALFLNAICDAQNPVLESFSISSTGLIPTLYETAAQLMMEATISDMPEGVVRVVIDTSDLSTSENETIFECDETESGKYSCRAQVINLRAGTHTVRFRFEDGVGNYVERIEEIIVLESTETDEEIDFFQLKVTDITPQPMNRVALQLASQHQINYPLLIDYKLEQVRGSITTQAKLQTLENLECFWSDQLNDLNNESKAKRGLFTPAYSYILDPISGKEVENRFIFNFGVLAEEIPSIIYARCSYDIFVSDGEKFYTRPERETFDLTLNFKNTVLGQPGEAFIKELQREEASVTNDYAKVLSELERLGATADQICTSYFTLVEIETVGTILQTLGTYIPVVGQAVTAVGDVIYTPTHSILAYFSDDGAMGDMLNKDLAKGIDEAASGADMSASDKSSFGSDFFNMKALTESDNLLEGACNWWMCTGANNEGGVLNDATCGPIEEWWDGPIEGAGGTATSTQYHPETGYYVEEEISPSSVTGLKNICSPDYSKSLLASLGLYGGSFCLKGVIFNLGKLQVLECGYVSCLKEQSIQAHSISVCKQAKEYKECAYVFDEVSQIPYVNVFMRTFEGIYQELENAPMEIIMEFAGTYCRGGTAAIKQAIKEMVKELVFQAANAASEGWLGAIRNVLGIISGLTKSVKLAKVADLGSGSGMAVTGQPQNLPCHILESVFHLTEAYAVYEGAIGPMNFEDQYNLCEAARCNDAQEECNRGAAYVQWLGEDLDTYRRLISTNRQTKSVGDLSPNERAYTEALYQASLHTNDLTTEERANYEKLYVDYSKYSFKNKEKDDYMSIGEYAQANSQDYGGLTQDRVNEVVLNAPYAVAVDTTDGSVKIKEDQGSEWTGITTTGEIPLTSEGTYCVGMACPTIEGEVPVTVSVSPEDLIDVDGDGVIATAEDLDAKKALEARKKQAAEEDAEETAEPGTTDAVTLDKPNDYQDALAIYEDAISNNKNKIVIGAQEYTIEQYRDDILGGLSQQYVAQLGSTNDVYQAEYALVCGSQNCEDPYVKNGRVLVKDPDCNGDNCKEILLYDGGAEFGMTAEERKVLEKRQGTYRVMARFITKWLADQGYLENLKLSGVSEWGAERSAAAYKTFSPEAWKQNLCSGEADLDVPAAPVLGLIDTNSPAMTFAAERRELDENGSGTQYIYSLSYFIRAKQTSVPNNMRILLRPGDIELVDGMIEETSLGEPVLPGASYSGSESFVDEKKYEEVCFVFDELFPDLTGRKRFCRSIVEDAYNRGSSTEGEVSIFD